MGDFKKRNQIIIYTSMAIKCLTLYLLISHVKCHKRSFLCRSLEGLVHPKIKTNYNHPGDLML